MVKTAIALLLVGLSLVSLVSSVEFFPVVNPSQIEDGVRVPVEVFLGSKSLNSKTFVITFASVLNQIGPIVDLDIKFSVSEKHGSLTARGGDDGVEGDRILACAQKLHPKDIKLYKMLMCMQRDFDLIPGNGQSCAEEVGLEWEPIEACSTSIVSQDLLKDSLKEIQSRRVNWSPTIFVDGEILCKWGHDIQDCGDATPDVFVKEICDKYTGFKKVCSSIKCAHKANNNKPLANGGETIRTSLSTVGLDGTLSSDLDGDHLKYYWEMTGATTKAFQLISPSSANPVLATWTSGVFHLRLSVFDGCDYDSTTVKVLIGPNDADGIPDFDDEEELEVVSDELAADDQVTKPQEKPINDPCCVKGGNGGCGNEAVERCVCRWDDFCCASHGRWDDWCVHQAQKCGYCQDEEDEPVGEALSVSHHHSAERVSVRGSQPQQAGAISKQDNQLTLVLALLIPAATLLVATILISLARRSRA